MMRNHFILFSIIYIFLKAESETQKVYMCIAIRVHVQCMLWQGAFTTHAFDHGQWSLSQIEDICQNEKAPNDLKF